MNLLLGVAGLLVTYSKRAELRELAEARLLVASFCLLFAGSLLTVLEGFFWKSGLDFLEHACYAASSVVVAFWCWKRFHHGKRRAP
jgi:hypothetical protein